MMALETRCGRETCMCDADLTLLDFFDQGLV